MSTHKERIAILASGSGTNAENIIYYFHKKKIDVALVVTDNADAGVVKRSERQGVPCLVRRRKEIASGSDFVQELQRYGVTFIVLAGYLGQIGRSLLEAFPDRILNIHPALLPKYGGKGMYGHRVHDAVLAAEECVTGITIHVIDEHYDKGVTLCQATCPVFPQTDTAESIARRVHRLEYIYYPVVIEEYIDRLSLHEN